MITSFSFDGVSCEDLGLLYLPDRKDMYTWKPTTHTPHEQKFDGHAGGYYFGSTAQSKDFTLRCVYEENEILYGGLAVPLDFFRIGRRGKLVFSNRPWVYYSATIVNIDSSQITNIMHGVITITMRAYYPFGRFNDNWDDLQFGETIGERTHDPAYWSSYSLDADERRELAGEHLELIANSSLPIASGEVSMQRSFTSPYGYTDETFELYNFGTRAADCAVEITGTWTQLTISNPATGEKIELYPCSTGSQKYVIDSLNGKCYFESGSTKTLNYLYHKQGFLHIAPCGILARNDEFKVLPSLYASKVNKVHLSADAGAKITSINFNYVSTFD